MDYYPNITVTNGPTQFVDTTGKVDLRGDGNITVTPDTVNKRVTIGLDATDIALRAFRQIAVSGQNNVVADIC